MRNTKSLLTAALCALAGTATAQVDFLYTNISSTAGEFHDCITLFNGTSNRPLAQETTVRTATGSVRKARYRNVAGKHYLYWVDTIDDGIYRATDSNGNGVLDPAEFQLVFDYDTASDAYIDERAGIWWGCVGAGATSGTARGVWTFNDMNADGDFMDAGEANHIIPAGSVTFGGTTANTNDCRACAILPTGDCIWYAASGPSWFKTTPGGVTNQWLVYRAVAAGSVTPAPAVNPDFGTVLPAIPGDPLDRVAVDPFTGVVYLGVNFSATAVKRYIFACKDNNADGDVNDAGEVTLFFDGTASTPLMGPLDDIDWSGGAIYGSYEIDTVLDPGSQFFKLQDNNLDGDANDPGEFTLMGRTASTDDPTTIGVSVCPAGAFGSSCTNVDLRNSAALTSAGGTIVFSMGDIPVAQQNSTTSGFMYMSLTGAAQVVIPITPFTCSIGITPDALFIATAGLFFGGPFTTATQQVGTLPYPAGIPLGTKAYFAGFTFQASSLSVLGTTQTGLLEVKI